MCDTIKLSLSEFTDDQIKRYQLADCVTECGGEQSVLFQHRIKPHFIPCIRNSQLLMPLWSGHIRLHQIEDRSLIRSRPRGVEIPADEAKENGVWFGVAPRRIRGILLPGNNTSRRYRVFVLLKPASNSFERMTHSVWEPVIVGEDADPGEIGR